MVLLICDLILIGFIIWICIQSAVDHKRSMEFLQRIEKLKEQIELLVKINQKIYEDETQKKTN